ncbi:MAG: 3-hydroxyacyl-CoA dehydrogenase [Actinomycetaceae bacterium]|nr:3-hydroxyacyl-CoA dehydrogenase [Actinomycetaceae bacterium]
MTDIKNVTVFGTGVLGSQIAYQAAFHGFNVTAWDISEEAIQAGRERYRKLAQRYIADGMPQAQEKAEATAEAIALTTDKAQALADADIVIEAAPEILDLKRELWKEIGELAPEKTILCTNSSSLLPSDIKDYTGHPERFLAYHFANEVWKYNTGEVMATADTKPEIFETVVEFAAEMGMVPIPVRKEKAGYILNSLLIPFLSAAQGLAAFGFAEPEDIDKTWRIATGAPTGPFQILDVIGLVTPYNIAAAGDETSQKIAAWLKENYIDKGKLGIASGEGFYKYN